MINPNHTLFQEEYIYKKPAHVNNNLRGESIVGAVRVGRAWTG